MTQAYPQDLINDMEKTLRLVHDQRPILEDGLNQLSKPNVFTRAALTQVAKVIEQLNAFKRERGNASTTTYLTVTLGEDEQDLLVYLTAKKKRELLALPPMYKRAVQKLIATEFVAIHKQDGIDYVSITPNGKAWFQQTRNTDE